MIIDFRVTAPVCEWMETGGSQEVFPNSFMRGYMESAYETELHAQRDRRSMVKAMDAANVTYGVLQAEWALGDYKKQNDAVYRIAKKYPKKFPRYYLTINALEDDEMVKTVEREVKERGFSGLNYQTWAQRMYPTDKRLYPVYAKCSGTGHTGHHPFFHQLHDRPHYRFQPSHLPRPGGLRLPRP